MFLALSRFDLGESLLITTLLGIPLGEPDGKTPIAWEHLQEYIQACPHHGMEEWQIIQYFFHGLNQQARDHVDAAAGGSFLSLDVAGAKTLIDKIASNQSWSGDK